MPLLRSKSSIVKRRRISKRKFGFLVKCFSLDLTATQTGKLAGLNRNTVNRYFTHFRRLIISVALMERQLERIANGVEIDESYFGAKRVRGKRGRGAAKKTIVLGLRKRNGRVYAQIIPDASQAEILPIIRALQLKVEQTFTRMVGTPMMPWLSMATITRKSSTRRMSLSEKKCILMESNPSGAGPREDWLNLMAYQNPCLGPLF